MTEINQRDQNPNWKGNDAVTHTGNSRARRWYGKRSCNKCGAENSEIHHKDGNTLNNSPENIQHLCRKHHMIADGRHQRLLKRNIEGRMQIDHVEFLELYNKGLYDPQIAEKLCCSRTAIRKYRCKLGLKANRYQPPYKRLDYLLIEELYEKGLLDIEIAQRAGCHYNSIYYWRKKHSLLANIHKRRVNFFEC